jgi:LPS-assembly protein
MPSFYKHIFIIAFLLFSSISFAAEFQNVNGNEEIIVEANELTYNEKDALINANGNVYIKQGSLEIVTDKVVYDQKNQHLYALGNLAFKSDNKNIFFGNKAFFNLDKNIGTITNFKARLRQNGLLSSHSAHMLNEKKFLVQEVVFSTCKVCKNNMIPYTPLWQIKAKEALINQRDEKIEYRHGRIELFGTTVFYLPYFSTPTPNSKNKSGILAPKFKTSNIFGLQISTPYYLSFSPYADFTYTPTFSTKTNMFNHLVFRYLTKHGLYNVQGYFAKDDVKVLQGKYVIKKKKTWNGFVASDGSFEFKNNYFMNYQVQRVFDDTKGFTKKYDISNEDVLISRLSLQKNKRNMLLSFDSLGFQDLRENEQNNKTPHAFPWIRTYNKLPYKLPFNSEVIFSSDYLNLKRNIGTSYQRGTLQLELTNDVQLPLGQKLRFDSAVRYNHYKTTTKIRNPVAKRTNSSHNRLFGKLFATWRWPFIKQIEYKNIILEPIVNFIYNSVTSESFFNEDYQEKIINTSNIFSSTFFIGKDTIEVGSRINYGFRAIYYMGENIYGLNLGQSYKLSSANKHKQSNINNNASYTWNDKIIGQKRNIVGKFYAYFTDNIYFINNLSLNPSHLNLIKNEFDTTFKYKKLNATLSHILINQRYINKCYNNHNQELGFKLQYNIYTNWWVEGKFKRKMGGAISMINKDNPECSENTLLQKQHPIEETPLDNKRNKWISHEVGLLHKVDCLKVNFGVKRDYSKPKGLKPSVTTYLRIEPIFK